MNLIYAGDMKPLIAGKANPDWTEIGAKVKPYGAPGEEILLRAKTVHFINAQDWANYLPAARDYLQKYGAHIRANEKKMFAEAIEQHSTQ